MAFSINQNHTLNALPPGVRVDQTCKKLQTSILITFLPITLRKLLLSSCPAFSFNLYLCNICLIIIILDLLIIKLKEIAVTWMKWWIINCNISIACDTIPQVTIILNKCKSSLVDVRHVPMARVSHWDYVLWSLIKKLCVKSKKIGKI